MTTRARWRPSQGVSARFRILLWCTLLVAVALAASVVTTRIILLRQLSAEADSELVHEVAEVAAIQRTGLDPLTRRPFVDADQVLEVALARAAPIRSEELLAVSEGSVFARVPGHPMLPLERDQGLVRQWSQVTRQTFGTISTSAGTVRYLAVPVSLHSVPGTGPDVFVAASFLAREQADVNNTVGIAATVGVIALLLAIALAWLIAGRILAPVRDLEEAARSITESDLSHRLDVRGHDELARLSADFNEMLDRVERAFTSQRQFIDDASHELRTPITVIRGHLELLGDDPGERETVQAIMLDELDRMSRMVNELLLLARAERPDFLQLAEVDIATVTRDVRAKATALADRRWLDGGCAEVDVVADGQRLTQAWMQLAQNAVQQTDEGASIEIGSRVRGGILEVWVADSGPGVPVADRDTIFERFAVVGEDRRTAEHFGLGLPIVRAIAEAHHGRVRVETSSMGGALFTVELPLAVSSNGRPP